MLWRLWTRRRNTGRLTSQLIEADLRRDFGDDWIAAADDLDNAIAEFGAWAEGKIQDEVQKYLDSVDESNRDRKGGSYEKYDRDLIRDKWTEGWEYWVNGRVYRIFSAAGVVGGQLSAVGTYAMVKPATYDPVQDGNLRDTTIVWIDKP